MFENISVDQLKRMNSVDIIDIRSKNKYERNHILNARNVLFDDLIFDPDKYISKNEKTYIYCQSGNRSKILCSILSKKGYDVCNILGGYQAWINI